MFDKYVIYMYMYICLNTKKMYIDAYYVVAQLHSVSLRERHGMCRTMNDNKLPIEFIYVIQYCLNIYI